MRTVSSSPRWCRQTAALGVLVAIGMTGAHAGNDKKADTSTSTTTTKHVGTINPTNIAIVSTDLEAAATTDDSGIEYTLPLIDTKPMLAPEEQILADEVHDVVMGDKVLVAVLDSGFDLEHEDLVGSIGALGYDAIDDDYDPTDLGDGLDNDGDGITDRGVGHGTFVAGMVLRVAPSATILPIRVRDDEGFGTNEELLSGLEYAVLMGADVINLSLDTSHTKDAGLSSGLKKISELGITIVVSAGNEASDSWKDMPKLCWNEGTLTVGAVDGVDQIAEFSNCLDGSTGKVAHFVYAPGVDLIGPYSGDWEDSYAVWSGTSFSTGLASGAAALLTELEPDWTGERIVTRLCETVDPVTDTDGDELDDAGRLNILEAVGE